MGGEWTDTMGCGSAASEFDCMSSVYGNDVSTGNQKFQAHYGSWITNDDLDKIKGFGLNTIRIPVGYWIYEDLVDRSSEHFPTGGLSYLDSLVSHASSIGLFVIMDLHGAPLAQKADDAFTGQIAPNAGLFENQADGYDRAQKFLSWMATHIHNTTGYDHVGILEVVNEPQTARDNGGVSSDERNTMVQQFYPAALKAIRDAESAASVPADKALHVQFMDDKWEQDADGSFPSIKTANMNDANLAYDDHNYEAGSVSSPSQSGYMQYTCQNDRRNTDGLSPKFVQEWSLHVNNQDDSDLQANDGNAAFFKDWFAAQQQLYEHDAKGWVFWTYRTELGDYRWDYSASVAAGVIPSSGDGLSSNINDDVCSAHGYPRQW